MTIETQAGDEQLTADRERLQREITNPGRQPGERVKLEQELREVELALVWTPQESVFAAERRRLTAGYWRVRDRADAALAELVAAGAELNELAVRRNEARRVCGVPSTHTDYDQKIDTAADILMAARRCAMTIQPTPWPSLLQNIEAIFRDEIGVPERPREETE